MSVFRRLVNRLKMKKVHDSKPYSVKELMSMSNDELGRLYRDNGLGQPVGKHKIECMSFIIKCISVAVGFIIALPIPIVLLFVPESMLPPRIYRLFGISVNDIGLYIHGVSQFN